jgi:hypothetical protein
MRNVKMIAEESTPDISTGAGTKADGDHLAEALAALRIWWTTPLGATGEEERLEAAAPPWPSCCCGGAAHKQPRADPRTS